MAFETKHAAAIHEASLIVLEKTGIRLDHPEALDLLRGAGAEEDGDGRILIPRRLVNEALEKVSPAVTVYDRDGEVALDLRAGGPTYFGPGSDALYNVDPRNGARAKSTLADVARNVRLVDGLSGMDFVMSMGLPCDLEPDDLYTRIFIEMMRNTTKPLISTSTSLADIRRIHEASSIVTGGVDRPFWIAYVEPISPLILDREGTARLLYCAEHRIPTLFAAGANCGGGAPVTLEGAVVQGSAECLAGLVIATLKNEAVRFVYGANSSASDMRTGIVAYGAPEWTRTVAMYAGLGRHLDLPSWGTAGCSDAICLNAQAGAEAYESILSAAACGVSLAHDVAYLAHGTLYDPRMLVLCDTLIARARFVQRAPDLSEETLDLSVIDEVARSGSVYLAHQHTAERFQEALWVPPDWFDRGEADADRRALGELLADEVDKALQTHEPTPMPDDVTARLDAFLAAG